VSRPKRASLALEETESKRRRILEELDRMQSRPGRRPRRDAAPCSRPSDSACHGAAPCSSPADSSLLPTERASKNPGRCSV